MPSAGIVMTFSVPSGPFREKVSWRYVNGEGFGVECGAGIAWAMVQKPKRAATRVLECILKQVTLIYCN